MGDNNQRLYMEKFQPSIDGPILEVGSKNHHEGKSGGQHPGATVPFRQVYPHNEYIGVDLESGPGVDMLLDLAEGTGNLPLKYFSMVICCSVMEHVPRPWKMAENLTRLVRPGGKLYISVPWVWRYHKYPDDYFRFSFRAIMTLFPEFSFTNMFYSTTSIGEFVAIKENCLGIDNVLARIGKEKNIARKYLPCLMLHMLGTKAQAHQHAA